jgi:hypothetical protein
LGTLGELKARILDETKRPSLTSQVGKAVTDAIEFYAVQRFWFNEALDTSITTVADTAAYEIPTVMRKLILAEITSGGQRFELCEGMSWEEYRSATRNSTSSVQPTDIVFYGANLYLYPTPAGEYPLSLSYSSALDGFLDSEDVIDDSRSNAWSTEAEPLIRARAKWDLYFNVIRDYDEANLCAQAEATWLGRLQTRSAGYGKPRRVQAMAF